MEMIKVDYDKEVNVAYIYLNSISEGEVDKTISLNDSINIDLDSDGKILGIEVLNAEENLSQNVLKSIKSVN